MSRLGERAGTVDGGLGLALIVRDEESVLPTLLKSIDGAFDQVALIDTGSTDRTVAIFETWAQRQALPLGYRVETFPWCDDFAAARNYADAQLNTAWTCNADADDEIRGAKNLRGVAANAAPEVEMLSFEYIDGVVLTRPRLVRRGAGRWVGRVHEVPVVRGREKVESRLIATWRHRSPSPPKARDLRIARRWVLDEPDCPQALAVAVVGEITQGNPSVGFQHIRRYRALPVVRADLGPTRLAAAGSAAIKLEGLVEPWGGPASCLDDRVLTEIVGEFNELLMAAMVRTPRYWARLGASWPKH